MSLHTSRTVTTLKAMDRNEFKDFTDFVQSPFSKSSPMVRKSFAYLKSCAPQFEKATCNKEMFSKKVFGKQPSKGAGKEVNRLMHELSDVIDKFITWQYAEARDIIKYQALMPWYHRKNLQAAAKKVFKDVEHLIQTSHDDEIREVYLNYLQHKINQYVAQGDRSQLLLAFTRFNTLLHEHYGIEQVQSEIGMDNLKEFMGKDLVERTGKTAPGFLSLSFQRELQLQKKLQTFLSHPDIATHQYLMKCANDHSLHISMEDRQKLLTILANNLRKLFTGTAVSEEAVEIYRHMMKIREIVYDGSINYALYRDMIFHLCLLGRVAEAEAFQESVGEKILGAPDVENFIAAYRAFILFERKQFTDALKLASAAKIVDHLTDIHLRILKIKIAYEVNDSNLLNAYINALRKFVTIKIKKELDQHYSAQLLLFATGVLKLSKIDTTRKVELLKLKKEINAAKVISSKLWLLEKVDAKLNTSR